MDKVDPIARDTSGSDRITQHARYTVDCSAYERCRCFPPACVQQMGAPPYAWQQKSTRGGGGVTRHAQ